MKQKNNKTFTGIFLVAVAILAILFIYQSLYQGNITTPYDKSSEQRIKFEIKEGETAKTIVENLEENKLIRSSHFALQYIKEQKIGDTFKTGSYVLRQNMSPKEIVTELTSSSGGEEWITIIEGWDVQDIAHYLEEKGYGTYDEIVQCATECTFTNDILKIRPAGKSVEGFLYPDSYIITTQYIPKNIFQKQIDTFAQKIPADLIREAEAKGKNFYDILIMASMIEKEVTSFEDKQIVSGILWSRLEYGTPLGVDATVRYARGYWDGVITQSNLNIDSPYNTRKNQGLPPGPICNPGLESIKAAVYPTETDYYFYITEPTEGKVIYAKTLDEHNANVAKYLR